MNKKLLRYLAALLALVSLGAGADELGGYVQNCERELGFAASEVSTLDCNNGTVFKQFDNSPINDFSGHAQINANVDLVFACRWMSPVGAYATAAVSIELLIHNRANGATCFFAAKDPNPTPGNDPQISTTIVSPTALNASSYWMQPKELDEKKFPSLNGAFPNGNLRCVGCHVAGPYIASGFIAPVLQKFGLLNDRHDTFATRYYAVHSPVDPRSGIDAFKWWNTFIQGFNSTTGAATCANGCHSIGINSTVDPLMSFGGNSIVPSLINDRAEIIDFGVMPANNPPNKDRGSSYRWVNMNSPLSNPNGELELLGNVKYFYPKLWCPNPVSITAHVVDSDETISPSDVPDKLNTFNLQDGLICLNADQSNGTCHNYRTRYMCNGKWTAFQDVDRPSGSGDMEPRSNFRGCANPTWIQAQYQSGGVWVYVNGPADRFAEFDTNGLVCYNSQQNNGQCSNYVVKFDCP